MGWRAIPFPIKPLRVRQVPKPESQLYDSPRILKAPFPRRRDFINTIHCGIDQVNIEEFRRTAFTPEKPIFIKGFKLQEDFSIPAATKWFQRKGGNHISSLSPLTGRLVPSEYLSRFGDTTLPYEAVIESGEDFIQIWRNWPAAQHPYGDFTELLTLLSDIASRRPPGSVPTFHRFNGPLSLLLQTYKSWPDSFHESNSLKLRLNPPQMPRLYIAQAQIADLPQQLQDDLPTPRLVKEAGKGDIYGANIWMGIPETYTPLHKDPNPNLFVQLAGEKDIRLLAPEFGAKVFEEAQRKIGANSSPSIRGEEMMEGPEERALDKLVWSGIRPKAGPMHWGQTKREGYHVRVFPGDALFIPKGWWHSIKSKGYGVNASVNWWFR